MPNPTDPKLRSFIPVSEDSPFPIQNLPLGVFRPKAGGDARVGSIIGNQVIDLAKLEQEKLLDLPSCTPGLFSQSSINAFLARGRGAWSRFRSSLTELFSEDNATLRDNKNLLAEVLHPVETVDLLLPAKIRDYTDYYSSKFHANNVGTMIRGAENALQENWLHLPVAYHGRASSIVASGTDIQRPCGQTGPGAFGPSKGLDFELEMGFFVGPGTELGEPIAIENAADHIYGMVLVNDWSARDIQKWEYVPLGPFLAKNFATSISPWVVSLDSLSPFQLPIPTQEPAPLPYLTCPNDKTYDIRLEVSLTPGMNGETQTLTESNFHHLYWTIAQQLAHHTVNGCNMQPGDLLASGTISGPEKESRGCMLELAWRGAEPIELNDGTTRVFLQDGDCITMSGYAQGDGYRVGFGEVTGRILPARELP